MPPAWSSAISTDLSTSPGHRLEHLVGGQPVAAADPLGGLQVEPAGEHRCPRPHQPLRFGAQLEAPLHRRPQRPMPRQRRPVAGGQQPEPVIQPRRQLLHRQRPQPGRRQLDRQRHPVQPPADPRHQRGVVAGDHEPRPDRRRPLGEQRHPRIPHARPAATGSAGSGTGNGGTGYTCSPVTCSTSRLVASTRNPGAAATARVPARARRRPGARSCPAPAAPADPPGNRPVPRPDPASDWSRMRTASDTACDSSSGSCNPASSTSHTPSGNDRRTCAGHPQRQPGLAHPAQPGQRHQPRRGQQPPHLGLARDEVSGQIKFPFKRRPARR